MAAQNILDRIVFYKKEEISKAKKEFPAALLEKQAATRQVFYSMKKFLQNPEKNGIIAEFKRRSPSKGVINMHSTVEAVTGAYAQQGASMLSVLTDAPSFGGSSEDLRRARFNELPVLRKDFMLDEYQLLESRAIGADVVLLIAACLTPLQTKKMAVAAHDLNLEVLLEIHDETELDHLCDEVDVVGINNRDLKTFTVDLDRSIRLAARLPEDKLRVAESGIRDVETLLRLKRAGFDGFLIGEQFMRAPDPAIAFVSFVDQIKSNTHESEGLRNDPARPGSEAGRNGY